EGVVAELGKELAPLAECYDPRLAAVRQDLRRTLTLVDGTLLKALPRLAGSMWKTSRTGNAMHGWRMHCQFDLSLGVPLAAELTVVAGCAARIERRANHAVRLVHVRAEVHPRAARGGSTKPLGPPKAEVLILATNLLDVPAEVIALIYRYRWTIELFFRFFKQ